MTTTTTVTNYPDGRVATDTFVDGQLVERVVVDGGNVNPWSVITTTYDNAGQPETRVFDYDNGDRTTINYTNGVQSSRVLEDLSDTKAWTQRTEILDSAGNLESSVVLQDSGATLERTYDLNGDVQQTIETNAAGDERITTDNGNNFSWSQRTEDLNPANGDPISIVLEFDNGRVATSSFVEGELSSRTWEDLGNVYEWTTIDDTFDENGDFASRVKTLDNGTVVTNGYTDGVLTSVETTDGGNVHNWASSIIVRDTEGNITERGFDYDNGTELRFIYDTGTGNIVQRTIDDIADAFEFTSQESNYDAAGNLTSSETVFDDGRSHVTTYDPADGDKVQGVESDLGNLYDWTTRTTDYDANGEADTLTILYDDETTEVFDLGGDNIF